jgi:signal transduction histidine kinase
MAMLCLTVGTLGVPVTASSQGLPPSGLSQLYHQAWGLREGVPGSITSVVQTADGYLWLANPSGLYRFDGVRFERLDEQASGGPRLIPSQLAATPDGALWITTRGGGVSRLVDGRVTRYNEEDGVPAGQISAITVDRSGDVWLGGAANVVRFDGHRWHDVGAEQGVTGRVSALFADRDNALWIAAGGKVFILPHGAARARETAIAGQIRGFSQHADGTVWIGSVERRMWPVNADGSVFATPTYPAQSRPLLFDRRGALWRPHAARGILRSVLPSGRDSPEPPGATDDAFDVLDGLTADDVFDIFQDRESNIWVATGGGLDLFRETPLVAAPFPRNAHASRVAAGPQGEVWAGGENYPLTRLHRGVVTSFAVPPPIRAVERDSAGTIWVWSGEGLWRQNGGAFTPMPPAPFSAIEPLTLVSDRPGRVVLSFAEHGMWTFGNGKWSPLTIPGLPRSSGALRLGVRDSLGRVWLAFRGGTLAVIDGDRTEIQADLASLALGAPTAMAPGPRRTWVGLERGLVLVEGGRALPVPSLNESVIGRIKGVVEAIDGSLWLNSDRGIVQIAVAEADRLRADPRAPVRFRVLDYLDGGIGGSVLVPAQAAMAGTDGHLWFVGFDSIVTIDPTAVVTNPLPPPVHVESVRAGGHEYQASANLRLPVGTTNIQVKYTGLSLAMPGRVRFRYRLEGVDADWQDAGARREAFYTNLSPGPYTFKVIAANNDGVWNESGASLAFVVPPAYYQTNAFRAAIAIASLGLAVLAYRLRVRRVTGQVRARLEERRSERERIARELHDTLLQGLQGLILKFQAIATRLPPGDATAAQIESALERADCVLIESRDRVRDLRVSTESSADVSVALAAIGDDLSHGTALAFRVSVEGQPRPLHPIVRDEAYWIGREALVNAFQHSTGKQVEVEVLYGARELRIRCRDDGKGMTAEELAVRVGDGHWGVRGMRERAARIGGALDVLSRPGSGTEVELRVPARMAYVGAVRSWWPRARRPVTGGGVS